MDDHDDTDKEQGSTMPTRKHCMARASVKRVESTKMATNSTLILGKEPGTTLTEYVAKRMAH